MGRAEAAITLRAVSPDGEQIAADAEFLGDLGDGFASAHKFHSHLSEN